MVNLTRIYTKTGDDGTTSLGDMSRTSKNDPRLEAYATVDEANSSIGVVLALGQIKDPQIAKLLVRVQNDLFDVGADLCTPVVDEPKIEPLRVVESQITYLEEQIDFYNKNLEPLRSFILPSGTPAAALLHVA
ncbi:MAG: cob(I)yrinic acid a,c-diamide adenosyltransferase, partial [Actinomycetes bacterium]